MIRPLAAALSLALTAAGPGVAAAADLPLLRHDAEVRLDPATGLIELSDRIEVEGRDVLELRIADWLRLEEAALDGAPLPIDAGEAADGAENGGPRRIALPGRGAHELALRLSGTIPQPPEPLAGEQPSFAIYGDLLPDAGEPGGSGRIRYRLAVTVPAPLRAVATGRLVEERLDAAVSVAVFDADVPSEPPALFVGPYRVEERLDDGLRLRTWFHPELAGLSEAYLDKSADYIRRYAEQIGPYPYAGFDVVSAPVGVGLGFPGLTYVGRQVLPLPFMLGRSLAHEILHNWWGNGVAADLATGNWVEGLTTYMADYALAAEQGSGGDSEAAREMRLGWLRDFAALPPERDQPVTAFVTKAHEAAQVLGYGKVAFIFHMLRDEIGDQAFTAALRDLYASHVHGIAGWSDIRATAERAAGRDLGWFFDQWLDRTGAPRVELDAVETAPAGDGAGGGQRLGVTVSQDMPSYRLRLPVVIETAAGIRTETLEAEGLQSRLEVELSAPATAVRVDPDHQVFRRLLAGESPPILRDVTLSGAARAVIAAADPVAAAAARALAGRLLDNPGEVAPEAAGKAPLLVIGLTGEVAVALARGGWAPMPEVLAGRGTARAWTLERDGAAPALAVAAEDAAALEALLRPLPHYGGRSWLVFEGARMVEAGVWPVEHSPLVQRLP